MKLALSLNCWHDEDVLFALQFGADAVVAQPLLPDAGACWDARTLAALRNRVDKAGLELAGLHDLPGSLGLGDTLRRLAGGAPAADALAPICAFIAGAGAAGIPLIAYELPPDARPGPVREPAGRGQAQVWRTERGQDPPAGAAPSSAHIAWLRAVLPTAERAGVRLAWRPTAGSPEAWESVLDAVPSSCHGLDLDHGTISAAPGVDPLTAIRRFACRQSIFLVQLHALQVQAEGVCETFLDEATLPTAGGQPPCPALPLLLRTYRAAGYTGAVRPAPPPGIVDDTDWGHKGQAFHLGYLRALLQAVERTM
jgi:mannonate dehydratase